jgi:hypothetical protein
MKKIFAIIFIAVLAAASAAQAAVNMNPVYMLLLNGDEQSYDLTVTKTGDGSGTVVSSIPVGDIECGTDCSETYSVVTVVTLEATADPSSFFVGWSGDGINCPGTGSCDVTVDQQVNVHAEFASSQKQLDIGTPISGGSVASDDGAISCGGGASECSAEYNYGETVTLTATPAPVNNYVFVGWQVTGGNPAECAANVPTCTVTMTESKTVTPNFAALPVTDETDNSPTYNNTPATANPMALDGIITGNLSGDTDQDWFKITADDTKTVTVRFQSDVIPSSDQYYWRIEVWQAGSPDVLLTVVTVGKEDLYTFNVDLPAAGDYYFVVVPPEDTDQYDLADYELTLLSNDGFITDPAESELNDELTTADNLLMDSTIQGSLMSVNDQDWYRVDVTGTDTVVVKFAGTPLLNNGSSPTPIEAKGNWLLSVFESNGTTLIAESEVTTESGSSELKLTLPAAGSPYYIVVRDIVDSVPVTLYNGMPYALSVHSYDGDMVVEQEPNNSTAAATDVGGTDATMTGQLMSTTDQDWFEFTNASAGTVLTVQFSASADVTGIWSVSIHDDTGAQLHAELLGQTPTDFDYTLPDAGDYFIKVSAGSGVYLTYYNRSQYVVTLQGAP